MQPAPTNSVPATNTMAIISVVGGAASWLGFPLIAAVVAIYCGHRARMEIRQRGGTETGDGLAIAGLVMGYGNVVASIIGCVIAMVAFGGFFAILGALGLAQTHGQ